MSFIHVVYVHGQAERMGHAHAAHPQHNLLLQPVVRVSAIEVVREPAVPSRISVKVSVEQINWYDVAELAPHVIAPRAHRDHAIFYLDRNPRCLLRAKVCRVPWLHVFALHACRTQVLFEIAFAVHQRKSRQRHAKVCCRAQSVSGQHAQAARVGRHRWFDGNLHRKIGDQAVSGIVS